MKKSTENYSMLRPKQIYELPVITFSLNNKQDLRDLITDYVLHNIETQSKSVPSKKFKSKNIKYPSINLKVNVNKQQKQLSFQFVMILSKYIEFERKNIYRQDRIEPLVVDILDFLDEIEEKTKGVIFEIDPQNNSKKIQEEVINLIIEKHHKDKQKKYQSVEFGQLKTKVIAKHTRVSYIDIEDQLKKKQKQFLLQINDIASLNWRNQVESDRKMIIPAQTSDISQRLTALIESGQLFTNPDKVNQLRKEKLIEFYGSNQAEYRNKQSEVINNMGQFDYGSSPQCTKLLKDWLVDISMSERYYRQKYSKAQKKKAVNMGLRDQLLTQAKI